MKEIIKNSPAKFAIIVGVAVIVVASLIIGITKLAGGNDKKPTINVGNNGTGGNEPSGEDGTEDFTEPSGEDGTEGSGEEGTTSPSDKPTKEDGTTKPTEKPTSKPTEPTTEKPTQKPTEKPTEKPTSAPSKDPEKAFKDAGGKYEVKSDGTVKITDGGNAKGDVVIPSSIDGKKVSEIKASAYNDSPSITSVTVDCEVVGRGAFTMCSGITKIVIGPNVKVLEENAFSLCSSVTSIEIQSNYITDIKGGVFNGCNKLASLTLPSSVKRINVSAFSDGKYWGTLPKLTITILAKKGNVVCYEESFVEYVNQSNVSKTYTYTDDYGDTIYVYEYSDDIQKRLCSDRYRDIVVIYK